KVVENGGVISGGSARFMPINKDSAKIDLVVLNGEEYDTSKSAGFGEDGKWEFIVSDDIGNKAYYYFYVISHSLAKFEYDSPYAYQITDVQHDAGDGVLVSYINGVIQKKNRSKMVFTESGDYYVTVTSIATGAQFSFELTIDKTPPETKLVGVEDGASTVENVTLTDFHVGETILIYKDGKLTQTITVTSENMKMPEINEKGDYKIVVTNAAGNERVYEFTRKYTANVATSIAIIAICLLVSIGLFVVLTLRKRLKV
ncbi:MAG: hypothetical protein IJS67_01470, partial [Clostridia bacterium]|nr:hypothetical protein [Clostridia bacterium]